MTTDVKLKKAEHTARQRLLNEPKGKLTYAPGEAFLLHVFWEAPSAAAAGELLGGLRQCAEATHRDTPCVPTYFFRVSNINADLCGPAPKTVGEHPQLRQAIKKLQFGTPRGAVCADLVRQGLDPSLLDLDPMAELPEALQGQQPVAVEFTELYLDERAFMEHAGSSDYLKGYGVVMNPALHNRPPCTIRLGTPATSVVEKILEPMLKEVVAPLADGCAVWRRPASKAETCALLSLDVPQVDEKRQERYDSAAGVAAALPTQLREHCTTCVAFLHPLREGTIRLLCVLSSLPPQHVLEGLALLHPARGEAHLTKADESEVREAFVAAGLGTVTVNAGECTGYVIHEQAAEIHEQQPIGSVSDH